MARRTPEQKQEQRRRPRHVGDARRHREEIARREEAMEQLHDARRQETDDPAIQRREARAADRHAATAAHRRGSARELAEQEMQEHRQLASLATPSKGALTAYRVMLPIGIVAAVLVGVAGLFGLASPGIFPLGVAIMALTVGVAVNAAVLFGLLLSLRATDERVRMLARVQAARQAHRVEQALERRADRHDSEAEARPTQVRRIEMHRVELRPRSREGDGDGRAPARSTVEDSQYRSR